MALSQDQIREVQLVLRQKGFDVEVDGILGPRTRQVLIQFQRQQGFQASGQIDSRTMTALGLSKDQGAGRSSTTGQGDMQQPPSNQGAGQQQGGQGTNRPSAGGQDRMQNNAPSNQSTTGQGSEPRQGSDQPAGRAPQRSPGAGGGSMQDGQPK